MPTLPDLAVSFEIDEIPRRPRHAIEVAQHRPRRRAQHGAVPLHHEPGNGREIVNAGSKRDQGFDQRQLALADDHRVRAGIQVHQRVIRGV